MSDPLPTLSAAFRHAGTPLVEACGGQGRCATCHVHVRRGADHLTAPTPQERITLRTLADRQPSSRLACQAHVRGGPVQADPPPGRYLTTTADLADVLGSQADVPILHPLTGAELIPRGKLVTRTVLEQHRGLAEVLRRRAAEPPPTAAELSLLSDVLSLPTAAAPAAEVATHHTIVLPPTESVNASVSSLLPKTTAIGLRPLRQSDELTPRPGMQVDRFLLIEEVGRGGAGVVFRALHTKLQTTVAVKFLRPDVLSNDPHAVKRFAAEAQLLARLTHPNVVRVLDFDDAPDRPYVAMEFVDGPSAADTLRQAGRLTPARAVGLCYQVADGLAAAQKLGVVHRDVKPGNILSTRDGTAKLVDLGLAVVSKTAAPTASAKIGPLEGTVAYMSPEQLRCEPLDFRSDMYSLGATLFHLLTGRLPFNGRTAGEVIMRHLHAPVPELAAVAPGLPDGLTEVIQTMMAKSPDDRYPSYAEVRRAFQRAMARQSVVAPAAG